MSEGLEQVTSVPSRRDGGGAGRHIAAALLTIIILSGAGFRLAEYVADRSLWLDEALLVRNVLHLSMTDLATGRLGDAQCAPPGFLLAVRAVIAVAGSGEQALRLIPLAGGLVFLLVFGRLVWQRLGVAGALAAVALAAWSSPLIYYANEFKQYSTDALVTVLLFALAMQAPARPLTVRRVASYGAAGLMALAFSQPAIFVLAAWGTMGAVWSILQKRKREILCWMGIGVVWVAFFAAQLWLNYKSTLGNSDLLAYHGNMFLKFWPAEELRKVLRDGVLGSLMLATSGAWWRVWLALVGVGIWSGWRANRWEVVFIALAAFFTALASLLQTYPLESRLLLFLLPLLYWLIGRGVGGLAGLARGRAAPVVAALLILPMWPMLSAGIAEADQPMPREQLRPVIIRLAEKASPGDLILVWDASLPAFDYYWPRVAHAEVDVQVTPFSAVMPISPAEITAKVAPLTAGHGRVWLIATHYESAVDSANLGALMTVLRQQYPGGADFVPAGGTARGLVFFRLDQAPAVQEIGAPVHSLVISTQKS